MDRPITDSARDHLMASAEWMHRVAQLRPALVRIFRDPDAAMTAVSQKLTEPGADARAIAKAVAEAPDTVGGLRGSSRLRDGLAARRERAAALKSANELQPAIRAHGLDYQRDLPKAIEREELRRPQMAMAIPTLTQRTHQMLVEAETARLAGGGEAYRVAVRIVAADKEASTELRAISEALTARFGGRAFTENARERDRAIVKTLVSTEERAKLETITPTFEAIRRLSQELLTIERRAMEKFVKETQPLLPAVTSHRNTVVDVARDAALAAPVYRKELESFAAVAPMIWREPVAAIKAVEQSMLKSERRDQLAGVIKSDPELFGQLRGSRRWIDRLTNAGAERKAALAAAEIASSHLRFAAPAFALEIEKATAVEEARRARMQVEVPRLSPQTAAALNGLAKTKDAMVFEAGVKALSEPVITELRAFEAALTKRLSPNVTARDQAAFASVPEANRKDFETARETLGIIARAVATDRQQRVAQQRIAENQQQSNKITR